MSQESDYAAFAQQLYDGCIISDPWIEGKERFRLEPVVLEPALYERLCTAAEEIAALHQELATIDWERPVLLDEFFSLTPFQKLMWLSSGGQWHGIARVDLFVLRDGSIRACEMNSDTPSGEAEAVILNRLRHPLHPDLHDPNGDFESRYCDMVEAFYETTSQGNEGTRPTIGIVYPTEFSEDLSMITLYREWLESRGCRVVTGSPFNLRRDDAGQLLLLGTPIDLMIRHYKTDWWSERLPVWSDADEYRDPDPLDAELIDVIEAEGERRVGVINPLGAVLTQNKLSMAFFWQQIDLFSERSRRTIRNYFPETFRLADHVEGPVPRQEWTLKSDYGCEGDEVVLGPAVSDEIWERSLEMAIPEHWVLQRYFHAAPVDGEMIPNFGLYLIGGQAAGIFTRLSTRATDYTAVTAPTFIGRGRD
jgi:glutathionylspermidine synthase